jgi:hypothetical protein
MTGTPERHFTLALIRTGFDKKKKREEKKRERAVTKGSSSMKIFIWLTISF